MNYEIRDYMKNVVVKNILEKEEGLDELIKGSEHNAKEILKEVFKQYLKQYKECPLLKEKTCFKVCLDLSEIDEKDIDYPIVEYYDNKSQYDNYMRVQKIFLKDKKGRKIRLCDLLKNKSHVALSYETCFSNDVHNYKASIIIDAAYFEYLLFSSLYECVDKWHSSYSEVYKLLRENAPTLKKKKEEWGNFQELVKTNTKNVYVMIWKEFIKKYQEKEYNTEYDELMLNISSISHVGALDINNPLMFDYYHNVDNSLTLVLFEGSRIPVSKKMLKKMLWEDKIEFKEDKDNSINLSICVNEINKIVDKLLNEERAKKLVKE